MILQDCKYIPEAESVPRSMVTRKHESMHHLASGTRLMLYLIYERRVPTGFATSHSNPIPQWRK